MSESINIKQFEQISLNAWPALQTIFYDGWILRFANGVTRRANSIVPLFESSLDIGEKIATCEDVYREHNLPVLYKMTTSVSPLNLDSILNDRGYEYQDETSLQVLPIKNGNYIGSAAIEIREKFDGAWLAQYGKFNDYDKNKLVERTKIYEQIRHKCCYLNLLCENNCVGCGLGVLEKTFLGIFDIVVMPGFRKNGFGRMIVDSLLDWGKKNGAMTAYLEVFVDNLPALSLYRKMGFKEKYKYWYRVKQY